VSLAMQHKDTLRGMGNVTRNAAIQNDRDATECTCKHRNVSHAYGALTDTTWPDGSLIGRGQCGIDGCECKRFTLAEKVRALNLREGDRIIIARDPQAESERVTVASVGRPYRDPYADSTLQPVTFTDGTSIALYGVGLYERWSA
jgi:hypothetical protein